MSERIKSFFSLQVRKMQAKPAVMKKKWSGVKKRKVSAISKLKKDVSRIKKSQEMKWFDVSLTSATGGVVEPLNNVPLGDDATSRDGRKIMMTACISKGIAGLGTAVTGMPRYAIVYDMAPNGVLPAASDIFTGSTAVAQVNLNNAKRFKILWDNHGGLGLGRDPFQYITPAGEAASYIWNDYIKIRDLVTMYKDTGSGTIAGTATGALYAVFLGAGGTTSAAISFRLRFLDS